MRKIIMMLGLILIGSAAIAQGRGAWSNYNPPSTATASIESYEVSMTGVDIALNNVGVPILYNNEGFPDTNFSLSPLGVVTYTGTTKRFQVSYKTCCDAGSNIRSTARHWVTVNAIIESTSVTYTRHRTTADGEACGTPTFTLTLNNGDVIQALSAEEAIGDNVIIKGAYSNTLSFHSL